MAIKINKTAKSLTVKNGEDVLNLVVTSTGVMFYESLIGREANAARRVAKVLRAAIENPENKKDGFPARVTKLANKIENLGTVPSFAILYNRLK